MSKDQKAPTEISNSAADAAERRRIANLVLSPPAGHSVVSHAYLNALVDGKLDQETTRVAIRDNAREIVAGDLSGAERMLFAQATSLNAICVDLFLRAKANLHERVNHGETYLKLALKAQNQCRMTLETLAAIKNPPVVYARQANFANGPQQVNNGAIPHAAKNENAQNELLEDKHDAGERLDSGAPGQTIGSDPALAAVGAINRTAKR